MTTLQHAPVTSARPTHPPRTGRFAGSLGAEWIKLWSVRSTWWCLLASLVLTGIASFSMGTDFVHDLTDPQEIQTSTATTMAPGRTLPVAAQLAQFALVALAMLSISTEYATGSIRTTLQAEPKRGRMLAAKAVVLGSVVLVWGMLLGAAGLGAAWLGLGDHAEIEASELLRNVLGTGLYLALVTVLTIGLGAAVRSSAGTLTAALVLLFGLMLFITGTLGNVLPGNAGAYLMTAKPDAPYGAVAAALILAAWTAACLAVGLTVLRRRDA
jgi:ABC-type transport system involved in multi-copper enzyme maturation permease subunit